MVVSRPVYHAKVTEPNLVRVGQISSQNFRSMYRECQRVYSNTPDNSPLRQYLIDTWNFDIPISLQAGTQADFPQEMLIGVINSVNSRQFSVQNVVLVSREDLMTYFVDENIQRRQPKKRGVLDPVSMEAQLVSEASHVTECSPPEQSARKRPRLPDTKGVDFESALRLLKTNTRRKPKKARSREVSSSDE